jgi:hypothetical protein
MLTGISDPSLHGSTSGSSAIGKLTSGLPVVRKQTLLRFCGFSPIGPVLGPKFEDATRSVAARSVF